MKTPQKLKEGVRKLLCNSKANYGVNDYGDWIFDGDELMSVLDSLITKAYEEGKRENNEKAILWTLNNIKAFEEEWSKYSGEKTKGEYLIERYKELHK